ncbi:MAG: MBL fold metallo-hydrolase [Candidatus Thorarchaeota archaeon]|jgi:phosphoribosyl 1,2-cyclic phosphate phosphodiesterase
MPDKGPEIVFLGTGAAITLPAFFCTCSTCEEARENPSLRRTRSSLARLGEETTVIDVGPDIEHQLEREGIRSVNNIFITHWHYDHFWGLAGFFEPVSISKWGRIHLYGTVDVIGRFERDYEGMKEWFELHTVEPGDRFQLKDATWEVVKTTHTEHSVGYVVDAGTKFAYLVDGVVPPPETVSRLENLDLLTVESTMDSLYAEWKNFQLDDAVEFWKETGIPKYILTHLSCHWWKDGQLIAGMTPSERKAYEGRHPGLMFAHDGMRVRLVQS